MQTDFLQQINTRAWGLPPVKLSILRLDLLNELGVGNKLFKLKYNLQQARDERKQSLLSFGGAWSNHIYALAALGKTEGFKTIGIIRGEPAHGLTPMLEDAQRWGMELHFVGRQEYRQRNEAGYLQQLHERFPESFIIPEGAANELGTKGCSEIVGLLDRLDNGYQVLVCACGTGSTFAGLVSAARADKKLIGVSVLKGLEGLESAVEKAVDQTPLGEVCQWQIKHGYHHGGYAKVSPELKAFMLEFEKRHGIPLDPVYTNKLMYALFEMIKNSEFQLNQRIVAIHSGGLQGRRGFDWLPGYF